jgi:hypothetical protein
MTDVVVPGRRSRVAHRYVYATCSKCRGKGLIWTLRQSFTWACMCGCRQTVSIFKGINCSSSLQIAKTFDDND